MQNPVARIFTGGTITMHDVHAAALVLTMAATTWALRFLPFLIFRKQTPPYITYLGEVLPPAIIGMLVIYCLRNISFAAKPFGIPELAAGALVVLLQWRKRNSLLSILSGTVLYMVLITFCG